MREWTTPQPRSTSSTGTAVSNPNERPQSLCVLTTDDGPDVDRGDLPDDLACAWQKYLEHTDDVEPDLVQLKREWEETQRRVREEGLYHDEPLGEQKT